MSATLLSFERNVPKSQDVAQERRHDLDAIRALAILALVFFHSAMPYVAEWDWHIRNTETSRLLLEFNYFLSRFRMAVLFFIAGVAIELATRRRSVRAFLFDRVKRLLVPLIFGIFVIVPPQIYFERLRDGAFLGSFVEFWPTTLQMVPYPSGNTSYHHLWFVFYLALYSLLLVPALVYARTDNGRRTLANVRRWLAARGVHVLGGVIALVYALLVPHFSGSQNVVDDVAMFTVYFGYVLAGWLAGTEVALWDRIEGSRRHALTTALLCTLFIDSVRWSDRVPTGGLASFAYLAVGGINAWCWVMSVLGYGKRWLNVETKLVRWAREASYPVYILHQTVIVAVAFFAVQQQAPVMEKFVFTSLASLLLTVGLYETLVRPYRPIRLLFGMSTSSRR